jgi:hypothetical protein
MRNQHTVRDMVDRPGTAFVRPSSIHPKSGRAVIPPAWSNEAEVKINLNGQPVVFRLTLDEVAAKTLIGAIAGHTNHSRLPGALRKIVDQSRGAATQRASSPSDLAQTIVESGPEREAVAVAPALTILRVGPLELSLLDRTARRGGRKIDLRPREFRLLQYMMERNDKILSRASLLRDVWNYKFVPHTNLVDVHMGRLRRKVDGPNEPAMIRNVRGAGFVLNASPLS